MFLLRLFRLKAMPWALLLQGATVLGRSWRSLSPSERARITELTRKSQGRPGNLSSNERRELRELAAKLDLRGMGRELLPLVRGRRGRRGRKRR